MQNTAGAGIFYCFKFSIDNTKKWVYNINRTKVRERSTSMEIPKEIYNIIDHIDKKKNGEKIENLLLRILESGVNDINDGANDIDLPLSDCLALLDDASAD